MFDCYCHLVNLDFKRAFAETRPFANSFENFKPYMTQESERLLASKSRALSGKLRF